MPAEWRKVLDDLVDIVREVRERRRLVPSVHGIDEIGNRVGNVLGAHSKPFPSSAERLSAYPRLVRIALYQPEIAGNVGAVLRASPRALASRST